MPLTIGQPLVDLEHGDARFLPTELLHKGANYEIVVAEDQHLDNKKVCIKAIRYPSPTDSRDISLRRALLDEELEALTLPHSLLPEPLDCFRVENKDLPTASAERRTEPILVYELQHGDPLRQKMKRTNGAGLHSALALELVQELALFCRSLHCHNRFFRRLNPDHVLLGVDDQLHIVGCSNIATFKTVPNATRAVLDDPFVAPEARTFSQPDAFGPRADLYSLGALLAYLLTGDEPLLGPTPFAAETLRKLEALGPGFVALVARLTAAEPGNRFWDVDQALPHLAPHVVPDPAHPDLVGQTIPAPLPASQGAARRPKAGRPSGPAHAVSTAAEPTQTQDASQSEEKQLPTTTKKGELTREEQLWVRVAWVSAFFALASIMTFVMMWLA
ncbi:MAG: hypothetical protein AUK47_09550 [Deltaproteobacteria bacterium CG2_30_63_29]|nr:MAG: hypothetical protein AUK47_09550 [Deltaproteobacteria bacterium CG2_30_63_29]